VTAPTTVDGWRLHAACRDDPAVRELFFPPQYGNDRPEVQAAKRICRHCPVKRDCLAYALEQERVLGEISRHGIFGELTPRERRNLARRPR